MLYEEFCNDRLIMMEEQEIAADEYEAIKEEIKGEYAAEFILALKGDVPDAAVVYYSDSFKPSTVKRSAADLYLTQTDVYFTPNTMSVSGRVKNKKTGKVPDPVALNCFFCDFDAGKDENSNYLPKDKVTEFKAHVIQKLKKFIPYTALVETRNGYHVYWFLKASDKQIDLSQWQKIESVIVGLLGADPAVKDATKLLRMPFTHASKGGKYHFDTQLIHFDSDTRYSAELLEITLKLFYGGNRWLKEQSTIKPSIAAPAIANSASAASNEAIAAVKELDHEYFVSNWSKKAKDCTGSFTDWLKSNIDIRKFLLLPGGSFRCIIHDDKNPSAVVFEPNEKYKHYRYSCGSSSCLAGSALTLIDLVATLAQTSTDNAISFLRKCFDLSAAGNYTEQTMGELIQKNQQVLDLLSAQDALYDKKLKPLIETYKAIAKAAEKAAQAAKIETVSFVDFPASIRHIAEQTGEDAANAQRKINICIALGLFGRPEQLADTIIKRDAAFNSSCAAQYGRSITYYRYSSINSKQLLKHLDKWISAGGTVRKASQSFIDSIFGEGKA